MFTFSFLFLSYKRYFMPEDYHIVQEMAREDRKSRDDDLESSMEIPLQGGGAFN